MFNLNIAPSEALITLSLYKSQESSERITVSTPKARELLKIVPRFPGSWTPSKRRKWVPSYILDSFFLQIPSTFEVLILFISVYVLIQNYAVNIVI